MLIKASALQNINERLIVIANKLINKYDQVKS